MSDGNSKTQRPATLTASSSSNSLPQHEVNDRSAAGSLTSRRTESVPCVRSPLSSASSNSSVEGASQSYGPVVKLQRQTSINCSPNTQDVETTITFGGTTKHVVEAKSQQRDSFKILQELYENKELCDLEVKVGSKIFSCHKVILACVSKYFRRMFQSDMLESRQSVVTIQDIDENAMKGIIDFAYTSKINMNVNDVQNLLYASSILQVEAVASACCDFMKDQLDPQNCIGVRIFAEQHGRTELVRKTDLFILGNFPAVTAHEEFVSVTPRTLLELIASSDLNVNSETDAYDSVMRWVKHDIEARKDYLPELFAKIRLPLIPLEYLVQVIDHDELIRQDKTCYQILNDAKNFHIHVTPQLAQSMQDKTLPRKSCAGVIFCVGGRGTSGDPFKSIECYDLRRDEWFTVADMSTKRRHVGVVASSGKLYAIGGHDGGDHLGSGEIFDPKKNTWTPISAMNTLRRGLAVACVVSGAIYALGGLDDNTCYSTVERYDTENNTWAPVKDMNFPRGGVAVAALRGFLYSVGGNDGAASLDSCERYDPHLNKWTVMAAMNKRRAGAGCAELHDLLYVVGGFDDNAPLSSVERYDPERNTWKLIKNMSCPRGGVGVAALAGKIYAVGGHDGCNYLNSVECYDPHTDSWAPAGRISACRAGAGVAFCGVLIADVMKGVLYSTERAPGLQHCVSSCV